MVKTELKVGHKAFACVRAHDDQWKIEEIIVSEFQGRNCVRADNGFIYHRDATFATHGEAMVFTAK